MNDFKPEHLRALLDESESPRLSAYVPTVKAGDTEQNAIRFKNLVLGARGALESAEIEDDDVKAIVDILDEHFRADWIVEHQHEGLAVFASTHDCRLLRCPRELDPLLTVDRRYHVLPLLPLAEKARRYWVLALSRQCTRLIHAYCDGGHEYDLESTDVPRRLTDVAGSEVERQSLQFHSNKRGSQAVFHGQGRGKDDELPELEQFCRAVGTAVAREIGRETPIVLAGEPRLTSLFADVVDDLDLRAQTVEGNHDETRADELAAHAWPIVASDVEDEEAELVAHYEREVGNDRTSADADVIEVASTEGRIDTLLLDGRILSEAPQRRPVEAVRHGGRPPGDAERRANRVTTAALRHGAEARVIDSQKMPADAFMAAVLRY